LGEKGKNSSREPIRRLGGTTIAKECTGGTSWLFPGGAKKEKKGSGGISLISQGSGEKMNSQSKRSQEITTVLVGTCCGLGTEEKKREEEASIRTKKVNFSEKKEKDCSVSSKKKKSLA